MPELPEVETIRRQLSEHITGAMIESVEVRDIHCYEGSREIKGEKIEQVERAGKYLFVHFASGRGLQVHLKMTGRVIIDLGNYDTLEHTRVVLKLVDGRRIFYWDTRMFGYIKVAEDIRKQELGIREKMGPEPWEISDIDFLRKLQKTGRAIKEAILDQSLLAGVGNIYASDGLWLARINPRRKSKTLSLSEVKKLRASLCRVMERGLATGGASDNSYVNALGQRGSYQNEFLVYGRTGEPCHNCGRALTYLKIGGRGSWMCENCQV